MTAILKDIYKVMYSPYMWLLCCKAHRVVYMGWMEEQKIVKLRQRKAREGHLMVLKYHQKVFQIESLRRAYI